jgi:hypothetical protein
LDYAAQKDMNLILKAEPPLVTCDTTEEDRLISMLQRAAQAQKINLIDWTVTRGIRSATPLLAESTHDPFLALQFVKDHANRAIIVMRDLCPHLSDPRVLRQTREALARCTQLGSTLVITGARLELPPSLSAVAISFEMPLPTRDEIRAMVSGLFQVLSQTHQLKYELNRENGQALLDSLVGMTLDQARFAIRECLLEDLRLDRADISRILARKAKLANDLRVLDIEPPRASSLELGGFGRLKSWLEKAKVGFGPEAKERNLPAPKGVLILGVPGCGKSLCARVIASQWAMPLLKLEPGRLYDKFIGETEKNFRRAMAISESMAPCVFWIDEIEKALAGGGSAGSDGGLTRRLLGAFLTWLQEKDDRVFVVATANQIHELPPELLRKGRFDEIFFVDLPVFEERLEILKIQCKMKSLSLDDQDLRSLANDLEGFSGAEIEQVLIGASLSGLQFGRPVDRSTIELEIKSTRPLSTTRAEEIQAIRQEGRSRFVPVSDRLTDADLRA